MTIPRPVIIALAAQLSIGAFACSGAETKTDDDNLKKPRILRGAERYPIEGLMVFDSDLNSDQIPDLYNVYKEIPNEANPETPPERVLMRKEIDVNFDGGVDIWRHYLDGDKLSKEELDYNFDGRVDAVNFFDKGKLVRKEIDVEFDQAPDVFKFYKDGELIRIERDTNNDGRVDYWEYYERGVLDRIGRDNNGDGRVDTWQER